jgi:hypothetical protein
MFYIDWECCVYIRRLSLPTVHFDGGGARVRLFRVPVFFHSLLSPWFINSERFGWMIRISILISLGDVLSISYDIVIKRMTFFF